jgi:hypothetical protein
MSTTRYLEFDSSYRNRKLYPNPSDFIVELSQSGQNNKNTALDPVCNASPILSWNNSFQENTASNTVSNITVEGGGSSAPTILKITTTGTFRQIDNFYVGATLSYDTSAGPPVITTSRRITEYKFINTTTAYVTLETALPDSLFGLTAFYIDNPTPLATNTASSVIRFYIPGGSFIDNFYNNYYLGMINPVLNTTEYRLITSYEGTTRLATLESATTLDWNTVGLNSDVNFVIRKEIPVCSGTFPDTGSVAITNDGRVMQLAITAGVNTNYVNNAIRLTTPSPVAPFSTLLAPYGQERMITKYVSGSGVFIQANGTTFTLDISASPVDNYYTGSFITAIIGGVNQTRYITSYNGATRTGTISIAWVGIVGNENWFIRTITIDRPFTVNPSLSANTYEIETFTRDNCVPFSYSGSMVSLTEGVCYEVELLNLIMPNSTLKSGRGGRSAFYPYMYLELEQLSCSNSGSKGIIYSNNPNSFKMMYRVPMDDTPTPLISTFIKVDGDGMTHTIKFRPNDSFRVSIFHASGEPFQTVATDYYSPTEPNPMVQISACFAFKRV